MNSALLYRADPLHAELGDDFLDVVEAATFPRLELSYFDRDRPCTLLIDEIESIWKTEFDWTRSVIRSRSSVLRLMVSPFRASRGSLVALAPPPGVLLPLVLLLGPAEDRGEGTPSRSRLRLAARIEESLELLRSHELPLKA